MNEIADDIQFHPTLTCRVIEKTEQGIRFQDLSGDYDHLEDRSKARKLFTSVQPGDVLRVFDVQVEIYRREGQGRIGYYRVYNSPVRIEARGEPAEAVWQRLLERHTAITLQREIDRMAS